MIRQFILLLVISTILGLGGNLLSHNRIAYIGEYREIDLDSDSPVVPPSAEPGDPAFIALDRAQMEFATTNAVFVDARDPEEFLCGTIPGSINIPFEYIPDEVDLGVYLDSCLGGVERARPIIVFCSGEECDLSLHLARNFLDLGYTDPMIFFGGSREWEQAGFEVERRAKCGG